VPKYLRSASPKLSDLLIVCSLVGCRWAGYSDVRALIKRRARYLYPVLAIFAGLALLSSGRWSALGPDQLVVEIGPGFAPVTVRIVGPKALVDAARDGRCRPNRHGCPYAIDWGDGLEAEAPGQPIDPLTRVYFLPGQFILRASTIGPGETGHLSRVTWSGSTVVSVLLGVTAPKQ
jgi:hypothetical protein